MATIRVFHADDSDAFTRLVAFWISEHEDLAYAGSAHSAEATVAVLGELAADVVLLDTFDAPSSDRLIRAVRRVAPEAAIVVYSGYVREWAGTGSRDTAPAGADAYVGKGEGAAALMTAIRTAHAQRTQARAARTDPR